MPGKREIDASIAAKADYEYLYDKPYEDKKKVVRVAGPFTVESLSPHRLNSALDENDELIDKAVAARSISELNSATAKRRTLPMMILDNLKTAGVQQAHKEDRISFIRDSQTLARRPRLCGGNLLSKATDDSGC